jgi:hypothetical protein
MSNLQVTREKLPTGTAEPQISGFFSKLLEQLDPIWDELFPVEQARIVQLLVERVDVSLDGVAIRLRTSGIASLIADLRMMGAPRRAA